MSAFSANCRGCRRPCGGGTTETLEGADVRVEEGKLVLALVEPDEASARVHQPHQEKPGPVPLAREGDRDLEEVDLRPITRASLHPVTRCFAVVRSDHSSSSCSSRGRTSSSTGRERAGAPSPAPPVAGSCPRQAPCAGARRRLPLRASLPPALVQLPPTQGWAMLWSGRLLDRSLVGFSSYRNVVGQRFRQ